MFFLRVSRLTKVYTCVLCLINIYTELSFFLRFTYYINYVEIPELSLLNCFDFLLSTVLMCLMVSFKMLLTCSVLHYLYRTTCHKYKQFLKSLAGLCNEFRVMYWWCPSVCSVWCLTFADRQSCLTAFNGLLLIFNSPWSCFYWLNI